VIIDEESLNDFAAIAQGDVKLLEAVMAVMLHDVPEKRLAADSTIGFGLTWFSSRGECPILQPKWQRSLEITQRKPS